MILNCGTREGAVGAMNGKAVALLENGDDDHGGRLIQHLQSADEFICIVAFAKSSGWQRVRDVLTKRAARGLRAVFVAGLDFYQTEPSVLRGIRSLRSRASAAGGRIDLYVGREGTRHTLHPKVYWTRGKYGQSLIVGSANLTSGGLGGNHELSALMSGTAARQGAWLREWIDARIADGDVVEATEPLIAGYEARRDIYRTALKAAERRAAKVIASPPGHVLTLAQLLDEMRSDDGPEGFRQAMRRRRRSLPAARARMAELAGAANLRRPAFLEAYERLIGNWHSSGIARGKTTVARRSQRFQAALRDLAAEDSEDPATLFDLLRSHLDNIPRAGTNVLTEVLHARDPARFPVMNRNSVRGIGLANITGYPRAPSKASVDGAMYARFTQDADAVRKRLRLRDFSELDALFNFAYWRTNTDEEPDEG